MPTTFLTPVIIVTVNGVAKRSIAGSTSVGFRGFVSSCAVDFAGGESPVEPGGRVVVSLGYYEEGGARAVFTGEADDDAADLWPGKPHLAAAGYLARSQRSIGASGPFMIDPVTGEIPAYEGENLRDGIIVEALLRWWGVPVGTIDSDEPPQFFGTIAPVRLGKNDAAWSLISELDRLTFMRTFDLPDGVARRLSVNGIPSSAAITLTEGVNLYAATRGRTRRGIVNRVVMKGLESAGGPGVTPEAERFADSGYIPVPPTYQSEEWQSNLAQTEECCDSYAARRVGQMNRLQETVTVVLDRARPDILPGMGLALAADHLGYDSAFVFWVEQVEHRWAANGITTSLSLIGTSVAAGLSANLAPIAIIQVVIEVEYLANGTKIWVVFADGSASYDPDGVEIDLDPHHGITSYLWGGTPEDSATPAGLPRATYVYATDPTGAVITLDVTDVHAKIGRASVELTPALLLQAKVRVLWGAASADLFLTIDGGLSWLPVGVAAVGVCAMGAPTYQLAWTAAGALYRVTLADDGSFVATVVNPGPVTAAWITIAPDGSDTSRAWAALSSGAVLFSPDAGQTWLAAGTIGAGPVTHIEESALGNGDLYATAGPTIWHSFDSGGGWAAVRSYPDAALQAARFASGHYGDLTVARDYHFAAYAGTSANTLSRLLEADNQEDIDIPTASKPAQFTGLTLGLAGPDLFATDLAPDGTTGRVWLTDDLTAGGNLTAGAYDTSFGPPRHIIRDGFYESVVFGAADAAFFKTYDKFVSVAKLKALTGPLVGRMIGYGPLRPVPQPTGNLMFLARLSTAPDSCHLIVLTDTGWEDRGAVGLTGNTGGVQLHRLIRTPGNALIAWHWQRDGVGSYVPRRSADNGHSWADIPGLTDAIDIVASGTTLYCYGNRYSASGTRAKVLRSTTDGATWVEVSDRYFNNGGSAEYVRINVDPANDQHLIARHISGVALSTDGGATWGAAIGPGGMGGNGDAFWALPVASPNRHAYAAGTAITAGGTISPLTSAALSGAAIGQGAPQDTVLGPASTFVMTTDGNSAWQTVDGGVTWAAFSTWGNVGGIAQGPGGIGDIYLTRLNAGGTGLPGDPYTGAVRRVPGGTGTPVDLTQGMVTALGALWLPWAYSVVIGVVG